MRVARGLDECSVWSLDERSFSESGIGFLLAKGPKGLMQCDVVGCSEEQQICSG
jgi:hypothetical protein